MLHFDPNRAPVPPRPAATLLLLRDGREGGVEILIMQRSLASSFMGGAVVFPGGRVEPGDADFDDALVVPPAGEAALRDGCDAEGRAARIAACRESLEEVGVVPLSEKVVGPDEIQALRAAAAESSARLRDRLRARGLAFDLSGLVPYARWCTPEAEAKRFDARFFVARAPEGQSPRSDEREAVQARWASPSQLLAEFEAGAISLFPPTHRTLVNLAAATDVGAAMRDAAQTPLAVICPRFTVVDGAPILALPGDPLHEIAERRVAGPTRFVLRGDRWRAEDPPGVA